MITDFHFLRPLCLLLLIIPIIGYYLFFFSSRNVSAWESVCDKKLLKFLLIKGNSKQRSLLGYLALTGILGSIIALSGPSWQKKEAPAFLPINPVMLLLNTSSDMDNNDLRPSRLARAKFAVDDLLKTTQAQFSLIVYTNEPYIISPSTEDKKIISNLLPAIDQDIMPENGDKLYRAIDLAVSRMQEEGLPFGNIVVFAPDVGQDFNQALSSAANAAAKGYKVNVVSVRADKNEKLSMLADKGRGELVTVNEINLLASKINTQISSNLKQSKNLQETWEDYGYWFLIIPLICFLGFFRRGALVILLLYSFSAQAGFFSNSNQDGAKAFAKGDYEAAANNFTHSQWKASSLYRQGQYEEAFKYFSENNDIEGLYNQGNALAKSGKIEAAIKKYEEVLKNNPQHEDAKFNLEYLQKQQQKQQQTQGESGNDSNNDGQQSGQPEEQQNNDKSQGNSSIQQDDNKEEEPKDDQDSQSDDNQNSSAQNSEQKQNSEENQNLQQSSGTDKQETENFNAQSTPADSESEEESERDAESQATKNDDRQGDFDEKTQAREMAYRNIPEDIGGLLRAFIYKEHSKNRYGDN